MATKRDLATMQALAAGSAAGVASGHVHVTDMSTAETHALSAASQQAIERQAALREALEKRKRARELALPTADPAVKQRLRELGAPICLFGEGAPERRDRLRELLVSHGPRGDEDEAAGAGAGADGPERADGAGADDEDEAATAAERERVAAAELFYTEGTPALRAARLQLAHESFTAAAQRVAAERAARDAIGAGAGGGAAAYGARVLERALGALKGVCAQHSAPADARPLSALALAEPPPGCAGAPVLAVGSWGGTVRAYQLPSGTAPPGGGRALRAHEDGRVSGIAFHPRAHALLAAAADGPGCAEGGAACVLTGGADGVGRLWSADALLGGGGGGGGGAEAEAAVARAELRGHADRLARVCWHPHGALAATASFDCTWRLWDVGVGRCLLLQEGASRPVYALAFHPDGSLCVSAGLDALVRVWDLRSGKCVQAFPGHQRQVLCVAASPDGHTLASGSADHTVRLWDLRRRRALHTIPAHTALVSAVAFGCAAAPAGLRGGYVCSASFDGSVRMWDARVQLGAPLKALDGHEARITDALVSATDACAVTCSHDRTWKLWAKDGFMKADAHG